MEFYTGITLDYSGITEGLLREYLGNNQVLLSVALKALNYFGNS
jgi:hypothetical protein